MSLTNSQYQTLSNHIKTNTDQAVIDALAIRNDTELARLYNLDSSVYVWKKRVEVEEYRGALVWTEVDTLTTGAARIWDWLTSNMTLTIDASDSNIRQGIADAFAQNTTTRANLLAVAKKFASLYESLYSTGTGTEQSPGELVLEGAVTIDIIGEALNNY